MGISISNLSELISYDVVLSLFVGLFVLLFSIGWFNLKSGSNNDDKNNKNHDEENNNERFVTAELHDKDCEEHSRLAAGRAAEVHDGKLFKQPPAAEDCPICFLRLPALDTGRRYNDCCGKRICSGCIHAPLYDDQGNEVDNQKCPFCRTPTPYTDEEVITRLIKRADANDPLAVHQLGVCYCRGLYELPKDIIKALELWHRAAELGYPQAYCGIGVVYEFGLGVEVGVDVDKKKAKHYYELGAMGGCEMARHNLGNIEARAGNMSRALKHWMIAVRSGRSESSNLALNLPHQASNGPSLYPHLVPYLCSST